MPETFDNYKLLILSSLDKLASSADKMDVRSQENHTILLNLQSTLALHAQAMQAMQNDHSEIKADVAAHAALVKAESESLESRVDDLESDGDKWLGKQSILSFIISAVVGVAGGWLINTLPPPSG